MSKHENTEIIATLNSAFQSEIAGIVRYLHYSFMIMGHNRIPIQKWLRDKATEGMNHAVVLGEKITSLGGHPTMEPVKIEETNVHTIPAILNESMSFEKQGLELYRKLVRLAVDDIALEEMARQFVKTETEHLEEVAKMLRSPDGK